jgi:hypothetical protein
VGSSPMVAMMDVYTGARVRQLGPTSSSPEAEEPPFAQPFVGRLLTLRKNLLLTPESTLGGTARVVSHSSWPRVDTWG